MINFLFSLLCIATSRLVTLKLYLRIGETMQDFMCYNTCSHYTVKLNEALHCPVINGCCFVISNKHTFLMLFSVLWFIQNFKLDS